MNRALVIVTPQLQVNRDRQPSSDYRRCYQPSMNSRGGTLSGHMGRMYSAHATLISTAVKHSPNSGVKIIRCAVYRPPYTSSHNTGQRPATCTSTPGPSGKRPLELALPQHHVEYLEHQTRRKYDAILQPTTHRRNPPNTTVRPKAISSTGCRPIRPISEVRRPR